MSALSHAIVAFEHDAVLCRCSRRFAFEDYDNAIGAKAAIQQHIADAEKVNAMPPVNTDAITRSRLAGITFTPARLGMDEILPATVEIPFPAMKEWPILIEKRDGAWSVYMPEVGDMPLPAARSFLGILTQAVGLAEQLADES